MQCLLHQLNQQLREQACAAESAKGATDAEMAAQRESAEAQIAEATSREAGLERQVATLKAELSAQEAENVESRRKKAERKLSAVEQVALVEQRYHDTSRSFVVPPV